MRDTVILGAMSIIVVGVCAFIFFVLVPQDNARYKAIREQARKECIQNGGKIIDYHESSAFHPSWACEGAKK